MRVPRGDAEVCASISIPNEPKRSPFRRPVPAKSQGASCLPVTTYGAFRNRFSFQPTSWSPTSAASRGGRERASGPYG